MLYVDNSVEVHTLGGFCLTVCIAVLSLPVLLSCLLVSCSLPVLVSCLLPVLLSCSLPVLVSCSLPMLVSYADRVYQ